ncbi:MAG: class I tRNA ligase family protein, partial [Pseudonocardiaceae bacterium]
MSTIAGFVGGSGIPEKPSVDGLEATWAQRWAERGVYRFDRSRSRDEVYSIDTPPPTVSGSLHVGHVFSYTHADILARYKRMRGYEVFYPMGWDDNGLPTERRVENYFGIRCDPTLPYNPAFTPPGAQAKERVLCSRRNFVELCHQLTATDEQAFEHLWRMLGYSVDWDLTYTTISDLSRKTSQRVFLDQVAAGQAYQAEAPIMWDTTNETAVAQAELEDREVAGAFHRLRFDDIEIETTRPELLPACVALVAHPDDERYAGRFGQTVHT